MLLVRVAGERTISVEIHSDAPASWAGSVLYDFLAREGEVYDEVVADMRRTGARYKRMALEGPTAPPTGVRHN